MLLTSSILIDFLLIGIFFILLGHSWVLYQRRRFVVFDPLNFFWAGALVIYVIQPIQYYEQLIAWYGEGVILETLFWIAFGIAFVIIGYEARRGVRWGRKIPEMPQKLSPKGLFTVAFVLIVAGLYGWKLTFDSGGGLLKWAATSRGGSDYENLSNYVTALAALVPVGVGLLLLHVEMHRANVLLRFFAWVLWLGLLIWMLYLGTRSRTIFLVVIALVAWFLPKRQNPPLWLLVPTFITLFIVTSFLAQYRGYFKDFSFNFDQIDWVEAAGDVLPGFLTDVDTSRTKVGGKGLEFSCTAAVIDLVPEQVDYNYGYSQLEFFTRAIPHAWWPEKRYPQYEAFTPIYEKGGLSGWWVPNTHVPILAGPSFGYVGHWYAVGGPLMLIVAGLFTGGYFRAIRSIYDRPGRNEGDLILYMVLIPIGFGDATGVPMWWIFSLPLTLIPLLTLVYFVKRKKRRHCAIGQLKLY